MMVNNEVYLLTSSHAKVWLLVQEELVYSLNPKDLLGTPCPGLSAHTVRNSPNCVMIGRNLHFISHNGYVNQ
ncbi:UNVERIFIED_CONTAM: hypothetical protein RF648_18185, partial [Kocuria sp. CPCC 205274]